MLPVLSDGILDAADNQLSGLPDFLESLLRDDVVRPKIRELAINIPSLYELLPTEKFFSLGNKYYYISESEAHGTLPKYSFEETREMLVRDIEDFNQTLFDAATTKHRVLWNNNTHITANINRTYIIGEGQNTICTFKYNEDTDKYSTTSRQGGDGTVLSFSASMNEKYPQNTYYASYTHNQLIKKYENENETPNVLLFIKKLINNIMDLQEGMRTEPRFDI
jgi:hypothetical protein